MDKIKKKDIIKKIAERTGIKKKEAEKVINVLKEIIIDAIKKDKKIIIRNFITIEPYTTKPREIVIPSKKVSETKSEKNANSGRKIIKTKPVKKAKFSLSNKLIKKINGE